MTTYLRDRFSWDFDPSNVGDVHDIWVPQSLRPVYDGRCRGFAAPELGLAEQRGCEPLCDEVKLWDPVNSITPPRRRSHEACIAPRLGDFVLTKTQGIIHCYNTHTLALVESAVRCGERCVQLTEEEYLAEGGLLPEDKL
jgi:hypothetical protein